jgi:pyruvate formate lyase activating enzyme
MSVVLFLPGCNFRCGYCHNADLWAWQGETLSWERLETVLGTAREEWADGAVITGGEPALHEETPALVSFLRERGFAVKLDTNGSRPDVLERLLPHLDYVAMDYKTSLENYETLARTTVDTAAIRESLRLLAGSALHHEFRITLIEGYHTPAILEAMAGELPAESRIALQPFVPRPELPDPAFSSMRRPSPQFLEAASRIFSRRSAHHEVRGAVGSGDTAGA